MEPNGEGGQAVARERVASALGEMGKGLKAASFYPEGHPALAQAVRKVVESLARIPLPDRGLEIDVTRGAILYRDEPVHPPNRAVVDLNRELYLRRASRVILLPSPEEGEILTFLKLLTRDPREVQDEGGLERILLRNHVSRVWVNRVDYEGLTEMLKGEEEAELEELEVEEEDLLGPDGEPLPAEEPPGGTTLDRLLETIRRETAAGPYRDHLMRLERLLREEPPDSRLEYTARALVLLVLHAAHPPRQDPDIAALARRQVGELSTDETIGHLVRRFRDRSGQDREETGRVLVFLGGKTARPLLLALAGEKDLLARKAIVDLVVRIGRPALGEILAGLSDPRWYVVRNLLTILGTLGYPDLAPHAAAALSHPDLRVKKEAIKALAKIPHPDAVSALGELAFHAEETVALSATAALSAKREREAVVFLHRRAVRRRFLFPRYRLAHEAIDSLRIIDTDEALASLEDILRGKAAWPTRKFRALKSHALRSISRMSGSRAREIVQGATRAPEEFLRAEAERIAKKAGW